jgi:hypothetical protein
MASTGQTIEYVYRSYDDLQAMGERVRDTAIRVTMTHSDQYGYAQQQVHNYPTQPYSPDRRPLPGYNPSAGERDDGPDAVRAYATAEFSVIPSMYTAFAMPDPNSAQPMIDNLYRTAATLHTDLQLHAPSTEIYNPFPVGDSRLAHPLSDITSTIQTRVQNWSGDAADQFKFYLDDFATSTDRQRELAVSLAVTLECQLEIKRRTIYDVWQLGETTIKVLNGLDGWHCPTRGTAAIMLTIAGSIVAVALAAEAAGVSVGLMEGVAATGEAAGMTGSILSTGGPFTIQQPLGGNTVPQVIDSMRNAMEKIVQTAEDKQRDLVSSLNKLANQVDIARYSIQLSAPLGPNSTDLNRMSAADLDITGNNQFYDR